MNRAGRDRSAEASHVFRRESKVVAKILPMLRLPARRALQLGEGNLLICRKKLFRPDDLSQRSADMNSLCFLGELQIYGLTITPWKILGWLGAGIFGARFLIQWIASERAKKSVIPFGFWECSALGSFLLLSYFAIYRHDSVGVLQNLLPLPIYLRNLYFRYTRHQAKHPGAEPRAEE